LDLARLEDVDLTRTTLRTDPRVRLFFHITEYKLIPIWE
jgi:hypothetical protein